MGQTGGLTGVRARGPKSGVFARGHMALSAEINRFVLYLEAPPPPAARWTPVLAIPGRDTTFRKNDSANGKNFIAAYHVPIFSAFVCFLTFFYSHSSRKERFLGILRSSEKGANRGPDGGPGSGA